MKMSGQHCARRVLVVLLVCVNLVQAAEKTQDHGDYTYERPGGFDFLIKAPSDVVDVAKSAADKKNRKTIAIMIAATGLLFVADQYLVRKSQNLGDHLGISHTNYQKTFASVRVPLTSKDLDFEGPFDSGSSLYFLGDGWLDVIITGGFFAYGITKSDNRALQTSSEIVESILASGAVVQALKHVTGRESPFTTQVDRGVWRFFPNQLRYSQHVPQFDAFPSGHLAAAMSLVTVTADNYPEYSYIRPVGYTLMTVLGFQMMNNGVHWASDYPLALVLGYSFGKTAVRKGRQSKDSQHADIQFYPSAGNGFLGGQLVCRFQNKPRSN